MCMCMCIYLSSGGGFVIHGCIDGYIYLVCCDKNRAEITAFSGSKNNPNAVQQIPPWGFTPEPELNFNSQNRYPTASSNHA